MPQSVASHHAFLYIGSHDACLGQIPLAERSGVDAQVLIAEQWEIADARALCERAGSRPIAGDKRSFVISCTQLTLEAQNALLKLFEEPPATAQFHLIVPRAEVLLPTLRSRVHLLYEEDESRSVPDEATTLFLNFSFRERMLKIAGLAKEKEKTKDTQPMRMLLRGIEHAAGFAVLRDAQGNGVASFLSDVLVVSTYSETRGASHKMLLEHLALSIPSNLSLSL